MMTPEKANLVRISLTLEPGDVDLLDRLAVLEGKNRSFEMRGILQAARPMLTATVEALENALRQRDAFERAVAEGALGDLADLMPEVDRLNAAYVGALSRLEGAQAARAAEDPRPSSHGGHKPPSPHTPHPLEGLDDA